MVVSGSQSALLKFYTAGPGTLTTPLGCTATRHKASAGIIMRAYGAEQLESFSGFDMVLQSCCNSWMHALVGNIPVRIAWQGQNLRASVVLPLAALVDQTP